MNMKTKRVKKNDDDMNKTDDDIEFLTELDADLDLYNGN